MSCRKSSETCSFVLQAGHATTLPRTFSCSFSTLSQAGQATFASSVFADDEAATAASTASANVRQFTNRSRGDFDNALRMTVANPAETFGLSEARSGGSFVECCTRTAVEVASSNGRRPARISNTVTAKEYWSTRPSLLSPMMSSGAMYSGVPMTNPAPVTVCEPADARLDAASLAIPKSLR